MTLQLLKVMNDEELHRYCWHNVSFLDKKKVEMAAAMLKVELAEAMPELLERITENPKGWLHGREGEFGGLHHGWGTGVRNLLRQNGFGEKEFGIGNLDDYYMPLVELAAGFKDPYTS